MLFNYLMFQFKIIMKKVLRKLFPLFISPSRKMSERQMVINSCHLLPSLNCITQKPPVGGHD